MSKETFIELESVTNGICKKHKLSADHAANLLRMSRERGWGWRLPSDSEWSFDYDSLTFSKTKLKLKKGKPN